MGGFVKLKNRKLILKYHRIGGAVYRNIADSRVMFDAQSLTDSGYATRDVSSNDKILDIFKYRLLDYCERKTFTFF